MMKTCNKYKRSRIFIGTMAAAMLLFSSVPVQAKGDIFHGTSQVEVTEDMVNNEPPKDYVVDEAVHRKGMEDAYSGYFLKDGIQTVSIEIGEGNLNYLLQHAAEEQYVMADGVTIGDTGSIIINMELAHQTDNIPFGAVCATLVCFGFIVIWI